MRKGLVLAGALIGGMVIGGFTVGYVVLPPQTQLLAAEPDFVPGQSGINAAGQSYGPLTDLTFKSGPDLFEVGATNGRLGYAETDAFAAFMGPASSLSEALESKPTDHYIPVYTSDGRTVIGEFLISAGNSEGAK